MDFRQLESFVRVVELASYTRAAMLMRITQPSLSRQIRQLEIEVGHTLLYRTGRGAVPTDAGRRLLEHAYAVLEVVKRAKSALIDDDKDKVISGRVLVGMPPRVARTMVTPLVNQFLRLNPKASISVSECLSTVLEEWLITGRVDIALLYDPININQLYIETLWRESMVLVGSKNRMKKIQQSIKFTQLKNFPLALPPIPNSTRLLAESTARKTKTTLNVVAEMDTIQSIMELASTGAAYGLVPEGSAIANAEILDLSIARVVSPIVRNTLVLATARHRPSTRIASHTHALIKALDYSNLHKPRKL
jgi:LysR family nitrogen assimilation transcriptional regulator